MIRQAKTITTLYNTGVLKTSSNYPSIAGLKTVMKYINIFL